MRRYNLITEKHPNCLRLTLSEVDEDFEIFVNLTENSIIKLRDTLTDYLEESPNE